MTHKFVLSTPLVIVALLCTAVHSFAEDLDFGHRCIFDELRQKRLALPTGKSLVVEVKHASADGRADTWEPIRILVSTADLDDPTKYCTEVGQEVGTFTGVNATCQEEEILTAEKKAILTDYVIPEAIKLHADRLKVQPVKKLKARMGFTGLCGFFSIPDSHHTDGITGYDYVLYLGAAPTSGNTIAWATQCGWLRNGRPVVGVANVSPKHIKRTDYTVRILAHEILHALGFESDSFPYAGRWNAPFGVVVF